MRNLYTAQLREPLQALIDSGSRINAFKQERYWYPLSVATYDVEEVLAAVDSLCSFRTTMWEKTAEFERHFSMLQGSTESIMVNSGSSADLLVAFAMVNPAQPRLQPGDEVLIPSVTWPTHVWSAMMAGLKVRFIDTDPDTLNVDIASLEAGITDRTRAISLVHLMGNPCDMDAVQRLCATRDLVLMEDCCESLGARFRGRSVGTFGVAGTFSFFFSHHITTMEGGMISCDDADLSDLLRLLRAHGWSRNMRYSVPEASPGIDPRYTFLNWGFNVRPTELQASFGLEQLERFPTFHRLRGENAAYFAAGFKRYQDLVTLMQVHPDAECSWFALPAVVKHDAPFTRDALVAHLEAAGNETRPIVAGSLARHPVSQLYPELLGAELPGADAVHDRGFYIGLHPLPHEGKLDRVLETFEAFLGQYV